MTFFIFEYCIYGTTVPLLTSDKLVPESVNVDNKSHTTFLVPVPVLLSSDDI
jgi:hypothetical protein